MDKNRRKKTNVSKALTCCTCGAKISDEIYLKHSRDKDLAQCIFCFSNSLPPENDKFRVGIPPLMIVTDKTTKNISTLDWNSNEEFLLLNGILTLGVGNWNMISEWIPGHSPAEIETHYNNIYINHFYIFILVD